MRCQLATTTLEYNLLNSNRMAWTLKFCTNDTEEDSVKLEVGRGGVLASRRYWTTWKKGQSNELIFPDDLKEANEIWIKATAEHGKDVHICVKYNGNNCQKMTFDEDEEHEVSQGDRDDCGC